MRAKGSLSPLGDLAIGRRVQGLVPLANDRRPIRG